MVSYIGFVFLPDFDTIWCHSYGLEVYLIFRVFYTVYTKKDWSRGVTAQAAKDDPATHLRFSCEEEQPCKDPFNFHICFFSAQKSKFPHEADSQALLPCPDHSWWALVSKHLTAKAQTCWVPVVSVRERPKSLWHLPASCLGNSGSYRDSNPDC